MVKLVEIKENDCNIDSIMRFWRNCGYLEGRNNIEACKLAIMLESLRATILENMGLFDAFEPFVATYDRIVSNDKITFTNYMECYLKMRPYVVWFGNHSTLISRHDIDIQTYVNLIVSKAMHECYDNNTDPVEAIKNAITSVCPELGMNADDVLHMEN